MKQTRLRISSLNFRALIVSVQRSGTRFTQRLLQEHGLKTLQLHAVDRQRERIQKLYELCQDEGYPVVVPLRHPFEVANSWRSRFEPLEKMFEQWRELTEICNEIDVYFLPIDHPDRQIYLKTLSDCVGVPLETRWKKYGHKPGNAEFTQDEIKSLIELAHSPFVTQFYGEDVSHGTRAGNL